MHLKKVLNILLILLGIGSLLLIGILIFIGTSMGKRADNKFSKNEIEQKTNIVDSIYQAENLDINSSYKPLSLYFNRKPIFSIGQKLSEIDPTLTYRIDPNSDYQDYFPTIKDYLTAEDKLSLYKIGKHSYINGIVYFSADQQSERIFNVSGTWGFSVYDKDVLEEMTNWLIENLFPELENHFDFKENWNYKIEAKNQIEHFNLTKNNKSWTLNYEVELK